MSPKKITEETSLKRTARDFLRLHGVWTFPIVATMGSHPGVADRLGIYKGIGIALEFKSAKGILSPNQKKFKDDWERCGGLYIEVRTVEDIAIALNIKTLFGV